MKRKIILKIGRGSHIISNCDECPYHGNFNSCYWGSNVDINGIIPDDCPLEYYFDAK